MPGRYNVYVFEDRSDFYVRPGVAMVSHEFDPEGVKVRNLTEYDVEVSLPVRLRGRRPLVTIPPDQVATIALRRDADGIFDYKVEVIISTKPTLVKKPAKGNSFPKIIVDP